MTRMHEIGEFGLIDRLTSRLKNSQNANGIIVGIGDDTAVLRYQQDQEIVATTDALVEGVHFRNDTISYHNIGYKAMAASISDVAAMGGQPKHALITLAIPVTIEVQCLEAIYDGIAEICEEFGCSIVGGDVVKTDGPIVLNVTLLGEVQRGHALLRSTAQIGDLVFVTGSVGGSAAGLASKTTYRAVSLTASIRDYLDRCHERPQPQIEAGQLLSHSNGCTSCNDVSDGLASELHEIAVASQVTIVIQKDRIPIASEVLEFAAVTGNDPYQWAFYGGEDYQLVGTISKEQLEAIRSEFQDKQIPFTVIGEVTAHGAKVMLADTRQLTVLPKSGYNHFQ